MKNVTIYLMLFLLFMCIIMVSSCENEQDVKSDIKVLKTQRSELVSEIYNINKDIDTKKSEVVLLNEKLKELRIYASGKTPVYILKLKLEQSHFSINPMTHIKDAANAIEFELPVDKNFYDSIGVGSQIVDEFRLGSFILHGSLGDWKMSVVNKQIK